MTKATQDARLDELEILWRIARSGRMSAATLQREVREKRTVRDLLTFLIAEGHIDAYEPYPDEGQTIPIHRMSSERNGAVSRSRLSPEQPQRNPLRVESTAGRREALDALLEGRDINLQLVHRGRLRMAELRQSLKGIRLRDPMNLLLDKRHLEIDLAVAFMEANPKSPVSVAYMNLRGLRKINSQQGRPFGDAVMRTYLQAVDMFTDERIEAYRDAGDRVALVLRETSMVDADVVITKLLRQLSLETVRAEGAKVKGLAAVCGLATAEEPGEDPRSLLSRVDELMHRARAVANKEGPNLSTVAMEGKKVKVLRVREDGEVSSSRAPQG